MHPEIIKSKIRMKGVTLTELGKRIGVDASTMTQVLSRKKKSARVEAGVAEFLNIPLHEAFPDRYEDPNAKAS